MSIGRRLWAGLRLAVLAGVCGVVLAVSVAGGVLAAYRWGEARATARSAPAVLGGEMSRTSQPTNQPDTRRWPRMMTTAMAERSAATESHGDGEGLELAVTASARLDPHRSFLAIGEVGAGKTCLAQTEAAELLADGGRVVVLDRYGEAAVVDLGAAAMDPLRMSGRSAAPSSSATDGLVGAAAGANARANTSAKRAAGAGAASVGPWICAPRAISAGRSTASTPLGRLPQGPTSLISAALERRRYRGGDVCGVSWREAGTGSRCDVAAAGGNVRQDTAPEAHPLVPIPETVAAVEEGD